MNGPALAWTVTAAIGGLLSALLLVEATLDLRALGPLKNGRRVRVRGRLLSEGLRFAVHVGFFCIGVDALDNPPSPLTWQVAVLIGGNVGLIANSLIALYLQRLEVRRTDPVAAEVLVAEAEATATEILRTAQVAAEQLLLLAERTAAAQDRSELERGADAAERTADNTDRIAANTEPER